LHCLQFTKTQKQNPDQWDSPAASQTADSADQPQTCGLALLTPLTSALLLCLCLVSQFEFEEGDQRVPCYCGAPECRKWMNANETSEDDD
jgi:hypothetical protein